MKPEEINFSAYQYAASNATEFNGICNPLFKLGIKIFAYFRFFNNGRYLYLCNNLSWLQFCLQNVHNNEGTSLGQEIGHVPEEQYHCFLWPTEKTDYLMSALYEFNIWNGLSIFKQNEDSIELWGFASDRYANNMQSFYIENIELLKDFTALFNLTAVDLIVPTPSNLAIYKNFKLQNNFDEYDSVKINEFIKATPLSKRPLITPTGETFLSTRELQCLNLLALGKSAKKIAQALKTSPRTVEKHLENTKRKIGEKDKESIIKIYKESVLHWL